MSHSLEQIKIAKQYVEAAFAAVSKKTDSKNILKDLNELQAMLAQSPELVAVFKSPLISMSEQVNAMTALAKKAKWSPLTTNMLCVMAQHRRLPMIGRVIEQAQIQYDKMTGVVPVSVVTARKLSAADQKKLQSDIQTVVGQDVTMQSYVDETLIGGVVIQIESTLIDGSIKSKLDRLERELVSKKVA